MRWFRKRERTPLTNDQIATYAIIGGGLAVVVMYLLVILVIACGVLYLVWDFMHKVLQ